MVYLTIYPLLPRTVPRVYTACVEEALWGRTRIDMAAV